MMNYLILLLTAALWALGASSAAADGTRVLERKSVHGTNSPSPIIAVGPNLTLEGPTVTHYSPPNIKLTNITRYIIQGQFINGGCSYRYGYSMPTAMVTSGERVKVMAYDIARDPKNCQALRERGVVKNPAESKTTHPTKEDKSQAIPLIDIENNQITTSNNTTSANQVAATDTDESNQYKDWLVSIETHVTDGNNPLANSPILKLFGFPQTVAGVIDQIVIPAKLDASSHGNSRCFPDYAADQFSDPASISGVTDTGFFGRLKKKILSFILLAQLVLVISG